MIAFAQQSPWRRDLPWSWRKFAMRARLRTAVFRQKRMSFRREPYMGTAESLTAGDLRSDQEWWQIYEDSFPAAEREAPDVIVKSVVQGVGMAFRIRREGVTIGLATTHLLKDPAAVFLVYLAVDSTQRNQGTGGELLQGAWEAGAERLSQQGLEPVGLIWEVDRPEPTAGDAGARLRRIAFFERHGGKVLDRPYMQPPLDGTTLVPMRLMLRPAGDDGIPERETIEGLVRAMYFEKYGAINEIDRSILEALLNGRSA